jgi:hypothetical protein
MVCLGSAQVTFANPCPRYYPQRVERKQRGTYDLILTKEKLFRRLK